MNKNNSTGNCLTEKLPIKQFLRIMRISIILLFTCVFCSMAESAFTQNAKVTLNKRNASLKEVLNEIESQTDYLFIYNDEVKTDKNVSIKAKGESVSNVLDAILKDTDIRYSMEGNHIILFVKSEEGFTKEAETLVVQQQRTISGKVTDTSGQPLPGATVVVKGTTQGTVTDADGNYSLSNVPADATLVFSFVGMQTQEVQIGNRTRIDVTMQEEAIALQEVVAVGYGSIKKSVITGAISTVSMETVQPIATQRVDQMLQGRAAGVLVLNTDNSPGGNTMIRIRGMNSIVGGNNALVVIDGFQGGDLNAINPRDIASIEILKDAAATAIYGAQGANGVILIETKKGKTEKPVINYSSEVGFSKIIMGGIELMSAAEYARDQNLYELANDLDRTPIPIFSEEEIAEFERTGGTNWIDEVYRTGITQTHQISLSGKTKTVNYFASGSIYDQKGIMLNSGYTRFSLRTNLIADIAKWLKFNLNVENNQQNRHGPQFGGEIDWPGNPVLGALNFPPTIPVYDENGNYSKIDPRYGDPVLWNPVASAVEPLNENERTTNFFNLYLDFTFLEGLTLHVGGGGKLADYGVRRFYNTKTFFGSQDNGQGYSYNSKSKDFQSSNVLNYTNDFGKHHLNATVVGEVKYNDSFSFQVDNKDFTIQETSVYNLGAANIQRTSSDFSKRILNSFIGRINYGYADKYVFATSFRADGSSVFGLNNKWAYFPSVSLGWRLSEESFISKLHLFDNLMIRASWGKTGNQAIQTYQTLAKISEAGVYPWDGGNTVNLGYQISSAANPNLKWETTTQTNIGIDLSMFHNRLRFTAEYYDKVTDDLLMSRELPRTTGLSSIIDNVGSMGNKGWEFSVDGDIKIGDLNWTIGGSFTAPKTTVLDLGDTEYLSYAAGGSGHSVNIPIMFLRKGKPFGQIMGFGYEGTWKLGEEEEAARYGQMPGDPKYTDVNNDGKIDYDHDFKVIGNALPDFIFGLDNRLFFRNWELTFLFQGTYGNDLFNVARIKRESESGLSRAKLKRWTPENQGTDIPAVHSQKYRYEYQQAWNQAHPDMPLVNTISFPASGSQATSRWIEDASYLRLKNLTLAYNLSGKKLVENMRIFFTATNLLTFTKYSGFDPEASSFTNNDARLGTDYNNYPPSRFYNFGIDITF